MVSLRPLLLLLTVSYFLTVFQTYSKDDRKTYIVYMGDHPKGMEPTSLPSLHMSMAQKVLGSDFVSDAIIHSYKKKLQWICREADSSRGKNNEMDGVVSVFPNKEHKLQTTRSWDFIGFPKQVRKASSESDIIIGVLDTGIWPESDSFSDKGFGPPPPKWKGTCYNFSCNHKLIGAKSLIIGASFSKDDIISPTPRDTEGHGTHCASTAAGNLVSSASLYGLASGTARGGVPSARIAAYQVCIEVSCNSANILAGFDEALADGVDIISISVNFGKLALEYFKDPIAIGAFHGMKKGILTSNSAGNYGPELSTMSTNGPWILSVAATTIDRKFFTKVQLGNGKIYEGVSINTFELKNKTYPLIHMEETSNGSVDEKLVKGKIVLVPEPRFNIESVSGAAGVLIAGSKPQDGADLFPLPASVISVEQYRLIYSYINSTRDARATIFKTNEFKDFRAPYAASFSSRGPNPMTPDILKPDIAAPGVDILAAWTLAASISGLEWDKRKAPYNILYGTSMACPHVTGAAAYVKSFHPNWSPAAIKSALMTTATPVSSALSQEAEFAYGAGQINPVRAVNLGLVYDISEKDYIQFLCGQGYDTITLKILTDDLITCPVATKRDMMETARDLNLPSFALNTAGSITGIFHRTVTNVGSANSTYKAKVIAPSVLNIDVNPRVLKFTSVGQKKSFALSIEASINVNIERASLIWDDGSLKVKSPIVVY